MSSNPCWLTLAINSDEKTLSQWVRFGAEEQSAAATNELVNRGLTVPKRVDVAAKVRTALKMPKYDACRTIAVRMLLVKAGVIRSTNIGQSAFARLSDTLQTALEKPAGQIVSNADICLLRDAVDTLADKCKYGAKSARMRAKKADDIKKSPSRTVRRRGTGASAIRRAS